MERSPLAEDLGHLDGAAFLDGPDRGIREGILRTLMARDGYRI